MTFMYCRRFCPTRTTLRQRFLLMPRRSFDLSFHPVLEIPRTHVASTRPPTAHQTHQQRRRHHKFNFWIPRFCIHPQLATTSASDHDDDGTHYPSEQQYRQTETEQRYARSFLLFFLDGSYFLHIVRMYISLWSVGLCSLPKNKNNYNTGAPCLCTHRLPQP
jgi:hypothetical protein